MPLPVGGECLILQLHERYLLDAPEDVDRFALKRKQTEFEADMADRAATRQKTEAEASKMQAEASKMQAEASKMQAEASKMEAEALELRVKSENERLLAKLVSDANDLAVSVFLKRMGSA